ncbi:5-formyltetrahydrofolate cyclo-ligase [Galemys pyrenaicus]|uniref:5-formyltetrahydrofolate cyclo-ligase n=1 Tax=Galemys pyrenaicus TaxID=202257 RepID=A0A8J6DQT8_GALPY|nr:5-formyltetrahydrofolate cyclo-ligase [Galemys pyrenaicus]
MAVAAVRGAKQQLRAELKQRLRALSAEERQRQSRLLTQKVRLRQRRATAAAAASTRSRRAPRKCAGAAWARARAWRAPVVAHSVYRRARRVSIFLSMPDEVDTADIVRDIFRQGKACFVPRYRPRSDHMDMLRLASPEEAAALPETSWHVRQPGEGEAREEALATGGLDLIFMPGLGFDTGGGRLGRGRGYYDAYLQRCLQLGGARPYTLALAFREQLCAQVPVDERDVPVDEVLYVDTAPPS